LTRSRARCAQFRTQSSGQEDFFFAYAQKTKLFTGPLQNGSVHLGDGNISYVSMNHFEAATATEPKKGIAQKETLLPTQKVIGIHPTKSGGMGGGAAILKQAAAAWCQAHWSWPQCRLSGDRHVSLQISLSVEILPTQFQHLENNVFSTPE
jgi:hypothetical protein